MEEEKGEDVKRGSQEAPGPGQILQCSDAISGSEFTLHCPLQGYGEPLKVIKQGSDLSGGWMSDESSRWGVQQEGIRMGPEWGGVAVGDKGGTYNSFLREVRTAGSSLKVDSGNHSRTFECNRKKVQGHLSTSVWSQDICGPTKMAGRWLCYRQGYVSHGH